MARQCSIWLRAWLISASWALVSGKSGGGGGTRGGGKANHGADGGGGFAFASPTIMLVCIVAVVSLVVLGIAGALCCYCAHRTKDHTNKSAPYHVQLERAAKYVQDKSLNPDNESTFVAPDEASYEIIFDRQGIRINAKVYLVFCTSHTGVYNISGRGDHEHNGDFDVSEGEMSSSGHAYWVQQPQQARKRPLFVVGIFDHNAGTFRGHWVSKDGSNGECMAFPSTTEDFQEEDTEQTSDPTKVVQPWRVWDNNSGT